VEALGSRQPPLDPATAKVLHARVERDAQKSMGWKVTPEMDRALQMCAIDERLGATVGPGCKMLRARIDALQPKAP